MTLTATVAPAVATGTITFSDGSTTLGTAALTAGHATLTTTTLATGTHSITASFSGSASYSASTSTAVTVTITAVPPTSTTTTLAASAMSAVAGIPITFTATVAPSAATGTVTFYDGTASIGTGTLTNGVTTFATSTLATGSHSITAVYGGTAAYATSTSAAVPITITAVAAAATTTTLTASAATASAGTSITFTATVAPTAATGTVTFYDGSTSIGSEGLANGIATFASSTLAQGTHSISAVYAGTTGYAGSASAVVTITITAAAANSTTTTLTSSSAGFSVGTSVTLTAKVAPTAATGTVTFYSGTTSLGSGTLTSGVATLATTSLSAGSDSVTAVYGGDTTYSTSTSAPVIITVSAYTTALTGVTQWKGNSQGDGQYNTETTLTTTNVNETQFGKIRQMQTDGQNLPQPLYVRSVNLGSTLGTHDLLIVATEHDSVYAYDGKTNATTPLWHRNFLNTAIGETTQADNHGGRSTFGGEIGITGTPVIDPTTGILYVVAATQLNGVVTDTLHSIDIRTGNDAGAGSVAITASYPGTGEASVNGLIPFDATQENNRPGLVLDHGILYVAFGSFSDSTPFHGWLFAFDPPTLKQLGVFNSSPTYRADYDFGSEAAFWNGGASPSFESDGSFYIVAANGSTNAENGGDDYGDTVLHMSFSNGVFTVKDWFTPFNRDCIDAADIEMGSGGFALLPPNEIGNGKSLGVVMTKEGRLYLLDRANLGEFNATADNVVQQFLVGNYACTTTGPNPTTGAAAEGPDWNRLYGNAAYWNGNLYMVPSNLPLVQYAISGTTINQTPVATDTVNTYYRGGNTVVSSNGNNSGIVWEYYKPASGNAVLTAFNATNIKTELWSSLTNPTRDAMTTGGEGFQVPVIIDGKVFATSGEDIVQYGLLPQ